MFNRPNQLYIDDIKKAISKIESYVTGMTFDEFIKDVKTIDAIIRNIEIIGEAARHISHEVRLKYIEIPWKEIIGTRNKVLHEYFGIDEKILWKTIQEDLPLLKEQIENIAV